VEVVGEQLLEFGNAVGSALLMHDGDVIPPCEAGDKALVVIENALIDVARVTFGQVMVVE
jgi:hypothetical protein